MAQRYGLFDSTEIVETIDGYPQGNRAETADFFAKYFSNFISNGVFARPSTNFMVLSKSGLTVTVKAGACFINGYMAWDSEDEDHTFTKDAAAHNYYLVQRMYLPDGTITKTWLTDPDMSSVPIRTATTYDLVIARVNVPGNTSEVTDSMITDYRFDTDMCGIVHGLIEQLDTSDIAHQLNSAAEEFINAAETSLITWQGTFDQWFNAVKGQLSGDAATALEANKTARTYAVCETAAETSAKTAALDGYYLAPGQTVYVRFINSVPGGATLNVNGTGNVAMYNRGQAITGADIPAGATAALVYNGERYDLLNAVVSAAGVKYVTASGTSAVVVNTSDGQPVQLKDGDRFSVGFTNEVAADATLNINGIGAYPIIDNYTGAAIVKGDIPAGYVSDLVFKNNTFIILNAFVEDTDTNTVYEMVKVWENASPGSSFSNQTISVNLSQYKMVAIEYRKTRHIENLSISYCVVGRAYSISGNTGRNNPSTRYYLADRKYTINSGNIVIANSSASYPMELEPDVVPETGGYLSDYCIPVRIYGIKGVIM